MKQVDALIAYSIPQVIGHHLATLLPILATRANLNVHTEILPAVQTLRDRLQDVTSAVSLVSEYGFSAEANWFNYRNMCACNY